MNHLGFRERKNVNSMFTSSLRECYYQVKYVVHSLIVFISPI